MVDSELLLCVARNGRVLKAVGELAAVELAELEGTHLRELVCNTRQLIQLQRALVTDRPEGVELEDPLGRWWRLAGLVPTSGADAGERCLRFQRIPTPVRRLPMMACAT